MGKSEVTLRQMGVNQQNGQNAMEKLASGLRINKAGDDAAGLAISEKMRGQIRGLDQASRNAQDGISMIQTAEGGLQETHSILQRMRELAVQSANDTNTEVDRGEIQKEVDQLAAEITRIADTTEFNTQNLLGGDFKGKFHIGANKDQNISLSINAMSAQALGVSGGGEGQATYKIEGSGTAATGGDLDDVGLVAGEQTLNVVKLDNVTLADGEVANYGLANDKGEVVATSQDGKDFKLLDGAYKASNLSSANTDAAGEISFDDKVTNGTVTLSADNSDGSISNIKATATIDTNGLQTGTYKVVTEAGGNLAADDADYFEGISWHATESAYDEIDSVLLDSNGKLAGISFNGTDYYNPADLSLDGDATGLAANVIGDAKVMFSVGAALDDNATLEVKGSGGIDVSSQEAANAAIKTINNAIEKVSAERSMLGATQNRLDHTINNLNTSAENLQAAESRVRDVDMAREVMEMTKNNILSQASQAMLAQANQAPQAVLQLLG
ncbi:hypothetical protein BALCAV_0211495 [Alkalihalobacillus alcalophilus ATCC 27647 = CGMCC 1.3604]|uniref:Flagellin n=1 Tax=Alkalihalobacillus alcalophilus ATCC 27647 = CGMCC 1.3604 TaxID=1218173 RepID=A0A094WHI7_ALKAL|nr:hypothetical protein BALCAV_0211495 [Alkalihalobacillus alcalophilus ATCC 27647 = CGMCC 1.3604]